MLRQAQHKDAILAVLPAVAHALTLVGTSEMVNISLSLWLSPYLTVSLPLYGSGPLPKNPKGRRVAERTKDFLQVFTEYRA